MSQKIWLVVMYMYIEERIYDIYIANITSWLFISECQV